MSVWAVAMTAAKSAVSVPTTATTASAGGADPVHEEGLLSRRGVLRLLVPEADEEIGTEADALPADEEKGEIVREHEDQHRGGEEVEVGEVAREAAVPVHVTNRINVDQEADAGDDERHDWREGIQAEPRLGAERPGDDAGVDVVMERPGLRPPPRGPPREHGLG